MPKTSMASSATTREGEPSDGRGQSLRRKELAKPVGAHTPRQMPRRESSLRLGNSRRSLRHIPRRTRRMLVRPQHNRVILENKNRRTTCYLSAATR